MSKIDLNALVNGIRGKIGNAVLRRVGGGTLLSSKPKVRTSEPSAKEKAHRDLFKHAAAYAKAKMADPVAKAEYQQVASRKPMTNAFALALRDFMKPPTVDSIRTDLYTGKINDTITIKASDDFKIAAVKVAINIPNGTLLETGSATYDANTLEWKYIATKTNATLVGSKIKVTAVDKPANETTVEKVM